MLLERFWLLLEATTASQGCAGKTLTLKTVGKNRKAEPRAQGWNSSGLLHPFLCFSQHLSNTVKGLGSLQILSYRTGKGASSEASLPLRFVFRISTIKKRPQPRSQSNS